MALLQTSALDETRTDCLSPEYNTARSHQSVVVCDRSQYPRLDSSEHSPSLHSDIFDAQFWQSEDAALDDALASTDSASSNVDEKADEGCWMTDGAFENQIRQHGIPLDTITERSSFATLPLGKSIWSDKAADRKLSAPAVLSGPISQRDARGTSRSLDERRLSLPGRSFSLNAISECSNLWSDFDAVLPVLPVNDPVQRVPTPPGLPRWPADLPRDTRGSPRTRRTSAYVRDVYQRLVGGRPDGETMACGEQGNSMPSRIPVPKRLARGGRTGSGYWRPPTPTHTIPKIAEHPPSNQASPHRPTPRMLVTDENAPPVKAITKRLSGLLKRASRLFEQQPPVSTASLPLHEPTARTSVRCLDYGRNSPHGWPLGAHLSSSRLSLQARPTSSPAKSYTTSMLTPEPLIIRPRSCGGGGSPAIQRLKVNDRATPGTPNGTTASSRMVRDFLFPSPKSERSADSCRSWDLPLTPLPFPAPPSPNIYSTARDRQTVYAVPVSERSTNDGVPIFPPDSASLHEYDAATDAEALNSIRASEASSTSSSSFVAGRSIYQSTINDHALMSDVFVNRPTLRVTNPSDEPGGVHEIDLSTPSETPSTPVHVPSPLRPRMRPNKQYHLFPDTTSHDAQLPPFAPGMPIVRALRSVSSRLRAMGVQHAPIMISIPVEHVAQAGDGAEPATGEIFAHPLELIEQQRGQRSHERQVRTNREKVRKPLKKIAGWIPSCFCQPVADDESFMEQHTRVARPVRQATRRHIVE